MTPLGLDAISPFSVLAAFAGTATSLTQLVRIRATKRGQRDRQVKAETPQDLLNRRVGELVLLARRLEQLNREVEAELKLQPVAADDARREAEDAQGLATLT